jgi:hypothetical protein
MMDGCVNVYCIFRRKIYCKFSFDQDIRNCMYNSKQHLLKINSRKFSSPFFMNTGMMLHEFLDYRLTSLLTKKI